MAVLEILFWLSAALIVWTHAGYPLALALLARLRPQPARAAPDAPPPSLSLIVAAHNEEASIVATLQSLVAQDRKPDRIVVAADNCADHA